MKAWPRRGERRPVGRRLRARAQARGGRGRRAGGRGHGAPLAPDWPRRALAAAALAASLLVTVPAAQPAIIFGGAVAGFALLRADFSPGQAPTGPDAAGATVSRRAGVVALALFALLLALPPLLRPAVGQPVALFESFYRSGAMVFGGGHVVLPLLHASVVDPGWVSDGTFLTGYGAAQALPGPLFAFAAYLGAVAGPRPNGVLGGAIALSAIFAGPLLLLVGALPFWERLRAAGGFRRALLGTNAAVVGILAAALYAPIWTSAVAGPADVAIIAGALALLATGRTPPIVVVALCAAAGQALAAL